MRPVLVPTISKLSSSAAVRGFVLLFAMAAGWSGSIHSAVAQQSAAVIVHVKRFAFVPSQITLKKGQTTKLVLISDDVRHGLAVKGLGLRVDIPAGQRTEVSVTASQTGDFPGACSVYCGGGHRDMEFMVHVVD
jgi:cytochrome c oxidase subunit II